MSSRRWTRFESTSRRATANPTATSTPSTFVVESGTCAFTIESGTLLDTRAGSAEAEPVAFGEEVTVGPGDSCFGNPDAAWAGERAVGDEQLVAVVTFLGDPTVTQVQYLDATPTP